MIRVVHVLWSAHFGGIERLVYDLARSQQTKSDLSVSILFGRGEGEFLTKFHETGLSCHSLDLRHGFDIAGSKRRKAQEIFAAHDVVHFHCFIPALHSIPSHARVVYTEHGNFGFGRSRGLKDVVKNLLLRHFLHRRADFISFNSNFTQRLARTRYRLSCLAGEVIHNGVDFTSVSPPGFCLDTALLGKLAGTFVIGTASRFAGVKRIDRLISAFAHFKYRDQSTLFLVGDGALRPQLESLVSGLGIAGRTIFAGYSSNVRRCFEAMHACVFPSQNESFGLTAVESLAVGKPTLVFTDAGGMVEILEPVCPEDIVPDEPSLCRRLEHYFQLPRHSDAGSRKRIEQAQRFDIARMRDEFSRVYHRLTTCAP